MADQLSLVARLELIEVLSLLIQLQLLSRLLFEVLCHLLLEWATFGILCGRLGHLLEHHLLAGGLSRYKGWLLPQGAAIWVHGPAARRSIILFRFDDLPRRCGSLINRGSHRLLLVSTGSIQFFLLVVFIFREEVALTPLSLRRSVELADQSGPSELRAAYLHIIFVQKCLYSHLVFVVGDGQFAVLVAIAAKPQLIRLLLKFDNSLVLQHFSI